MTKNSVILIIGLVCFCVMNTFAQSAGVPPTGAPDAASATAEVSASKTSATEAEASKTAQSLPEPDRSAEDFVRVSLCIADPGDVLYSILGHACFHLVCPYYDLDYIFTYESEPVKGKVFRFLANDLKMGMMAMSQEEYLSDYAKEGRGVKEYRLQLPPEVETELWRILDEKLAEGIYLKYDYIKRGCAISVVHCVDDAVKAANKSQATDYKLEYPEWGAPFKRTLREIFYDNAPAGWSLFCCMTLVGGQVDNPNIPHKEKLICPKELVATWQQTTISGRPLIADDGKELLPAINEYRGDKFTPLHASLLILLLAAASLLWSKPYIDWFVLLVQTLLGALMLWLLLSPLPGSEWSWLIIPFNPLPAVFWKWHDKWGVYYAVMAALWAMGMLLAPHRLVEYAHIVVAIAFALVAAKPQIREYADRHRTAG